MIVRKHFDMIMTGVAFNLETFVSENTTLGRFSFPIAFENMDEFKSKIGNHISDALAKCRPDFTGDSFRFDMKYKTGSFSTTINRNDKQTASLHLSLVNRTIDLVRETEKELRNPNKRGNLEALG